jgi:hypothetical protein
VREERVALEDGVDVALVGRQADDVAVAEVDRARVGSSKPPIIRSVVVLPQPDGPSSAKNEPCGISSEMPSTATVVELLDDLVERTSGRIAISARLGCSSTSAAGGHAVGAPVVGCFQSSR